ncbi:uncharacterized protein B0I36DRAFT_360125 [Microdochium trichocladiopsis]|uniref:Uncharacterized protein n=1 Tax=Microdochium trichocladiopsis TaxID=1682393 RepID=A0A9P9BSC6_9PEZI|nr:uncharacterized protein B0I36DRAFT_360125 [Microdochium trichocladiopsis]KAH7034620.1 hypothetical protein B0I36DRAFT_360125 [Microdochium trichocladiopsis]
MPLATYTKIEGYDFAFDVVFAPRWRRRHQDASPRQSNAVLNYDDVALERCPRRVSTDATSCQQMDKLQGHLDKSRHGRGQTHNGSTDAQTQTDMRRAGTTIQLGCSETDHHRHQQHDKATQTSPRPPRREIDTINNNITRGSRKLTKPATTEHKIDGVNRILTAIDSVFSKFDQRLEEMDVMLDIDFSALDGVV